MRSTNNLVTWSIVICLVLIGFFWFDVGATQATNGLGKVEVFPGHGVSFDQVDFTWTGAITLNSDTGQIDVNIATLQTSTGISSGYINVVTSLGWVVQNLPILAGFPYPSISTNFGLGTPIGTNVTSLDAYVEFSSNALASPPVGIMKTFPVGDTEYNAEGGGEPAIGGGPPLAPDAWAIDFEPDGETESHHQAGHKDIETKKNQCVPAAVATSLQWLEDTYPNIVNVPHDFKPGLHSDGSLVGELDKEMGRWPGDTVPWDKGLLGKLRYLGRNKLNGIMVKHQGFWGNRNVTEAFTQMTSQGKGDKVTADFIIAEIKKGQDVELAFEWKDRTGQIRGHMVQVVAAGKTLGVPWVAYIHDRIQSKDGGTGGVDASNLKDTDKDGNVNLVNAKGKPNAVMVISQSIPQGGIAEVIVGDAQAAALPYAAIAGGAVVFAATIVWGSWYARRHSPLRRRL